MQIDAIVQNTATSYLAQGKYVTTFPKEEFWNPFFSWLFVNGNVRATSELQFLTYADDTNFPISKNNVTEVFEKANLALTAVKRWLNYNKISLNVSKISYIIFRRKQKKDT